MRIALAQLNPTVGDLQGNAELVLGAARRAAKDGCELLVTPELVLCGYPPQDLLFFPRFVQDQLDQLDRLAGLLPIPSLLGCVFPAAPTSSPLDDELWHVAAEGNQRLSNAAVFVNEGRVLSVARKALLPTYNVFDEWRYFRPGDPCLISVAGRRVGVTICEDIWDEQYARHPVKELTALGAELIVNLSASPYHLGHYPARLEVLRRHAEAHGRPLVYCNLVGGQDELVFDGRSLVMSGTGEIIAEAAAWEADLLQVDLPVPAEPAARPAVEELPTEPPQDAEGETESFDAAAELFPALVLGLRDYARKCGFQTAVFGLSGGVDSALVACIATQALGADNVTACAMPSRHTAQMSSDDATYLAQRLGIALHVLPIEESVAAAQARFETQFGAYHSSLTRENLQSRERGKILMEYSNDRRALLLATGNKTEYALGYSTLYGDMCGGLAVIGDLNKLEVYALARWFNAQAGREIIPQRTLERAPSAELTENQVDPFDYDLIAPLTDLVVEERLCSAQLEARGFPKAEIERVLRLVRLNEYKRKQAPPILRVSAKAFGIGRRMPMVNWFTE